jgi:hypothetical protein
VFAAFFGMARAGSEKMNMHRGVVVLEAGDPRIAKLLREANHLVLGEAGQQERHVCCADTCSPSVACPGFNLYLCKQHLLHICSEQSCKLWRWDEQRQTCPISGIQYGNVTSEYIKDDPRTWAGSKPHRTPKLGVAAAAEAASEHIRHRASAVVKHLLYSNARLECNRETRRANIERGNQVRALYDSSQLAHGQPSYWTDRYRILGHWGTEPLPFTIYVFDQTLHDYYVNLIVQVWNKVDRYYVNALAGVTAHETPSMRADIDCIAVAVLYCMRSGLKYQNVKLLPKDDFILLNLPHVNQLPFFGIAKSTITQGEKIIERAFEKAISLGVPDHELELAPEQLLPAPSPLPTTTPGSTILGSNGETLYKLKKRKK